MKVNTEDKLTVIKEELQPDEPTKPEQYGGRDEDEDE